MQDPLKGIENFSPTITISQVLTFFERKEIDITRGMIQNYIRDGLLPPPVNKRFYTHKHLAALAIIARLKTVFDMPTIKEALEPYMDSEGLPMDIYQFILDKITAMSAKWQTNISPEVAGEKDGGTLLTMMFASTLKGAIVD